MGSCSAIHGQHKHSDILTDFYLFHITFFSNFCLTELCVLQFLFWLMGFVFVCVCEFLVLFVFHFIVHIFLVCLFVSIKIENRDMDLKWWEVGRMGMR